MTLEIAPYRPRPTRFRDIYVTGAWRLKRYSIVYDGSDADWTSYDDVWPLVEEALPQPAVAPGRPGIGIVIAHRGVSVHYLVVAWWDHENELAFRVLVRGFGRHDRWRPATGSESVCVYDLEILCCERDAYVRYVMRDGGPDLDGYLGERCAVQA